MHEQKPVAIVGMGAIMPDAYDAAAFWDNIKRGRYSITDVPAERWRADLYYHPDPTVPEKTYSKIGGWVKGFQFEPFKWGIAIPPRVLGQMDEAQQWAIAACRQALMDYGHPQRALDLSRTGVILGNALGGEKHYITTLRIRVPEFAEALSAVPDFQQLPPAVQQALLAGLAENIRRATPEINEDTMPGELSNVIAGRVANVFNLTGPNYVTDAACASSLAALQSAVEGLNAHNFDAVLTGGVDRGMGVEAFVKFSKIGALSADGSRPYADGANGFVMGEGAGIFLLKRLEDAERDGDKIYAVIRGIGSSSDGKGKGITAPNPSGQQQAIARAWANAGLSPATVTMIEGHGTSTRVGDVVEVNSLTAIFGQFGLPAGSIALGSVKSNIGHLKSAAGAAGLFKAAMALHEKVLPPTANFERPNPNLDFSQLPMQVNTRLREWEMKPGAFRRAGLSSFGFGGTNFHVVLEEYIPGMLAEQKPLFQAAQPAGAAAPVAAAVVEPQGGQARPYRGVLFLSADSVNELRQQLDKMLEQARQGVQPHCEIPTADVLARPERLAIDYGDLDELIKRGERALKGFDAEPGSNPWQALQAHAVFRGSGVPGKLAFMFPGQGSQYVNMLKDLCAVETVVAETFAEADRVMESILGRPLTSYIYVEGDEVSLAEAEKALRNTEITQPALLTANVAILRLMRKFGFQPDLVIGHSLGEYAALVAAGVLTFAEALQVVSARGREMKKVSVADNGCMAAVSAPIAQVEEILKSVKEYVVLANINSPLQSVIGGSTAGVDEALAAFQAAGLQATKIPVSHAFHTRIVAAASQPLRGVIAKMSVKAPQIKLVANVTGDLYPTEREEILDILAAQVASPVQFIKGVETLYREGARVFVECGPKRVMNALATDCLKDKADVAILATNHPRKGAVVSFNEALCGLYAAGVGASPRPIEPKAELVQEANSATVDADAVKQYVLEVVSEKTGYPVDMLDMELDLEADLGIDTVKQAELFATIRANYDIPRREDLRLSDYNTLTKVVQFMCEALRQKGTGPITPALSAIPVAAQAVTTQPEERTVSDTAQGAGRLPLTGSVVVTGAGLGLPGRDKHVFSDDNIRDLLSGENRIEALPDALRDRMIEKRVTRLVKSEAGAVMEVLDQSDQAVKLGGQRGKFDLVEEFGVPGERVEAFDISTRLAIAAGIEALRDAGIPLTMAYRQTSKGTFLPDRWKLPESMQDETGVIFGSAFPGLDEMAEETGRFGEHEKLAGQLNELRGVLGWVPAGANDLRTALEARIAELEGQLTALNYQFDRKFIFRVLAMGHSQFAEYIGARGPNTHVNAACATTTHALAVAEDWIRAGRCRRVIVVAGDDVTGGALAHWIGTGMLASGAATVEGDVRMAVLPFDRRRNGMIMGMGGAALVVEAADAAAERGVRPICEVLSTQIANSAFHGTRLDTQHVSEVMERLVRTAEERFGLDRRQMASKMVFVSHETYTPARGGSASAEIRALRRVFGEQASQVVIANTKGYTGHAMGVGVEDVLAVKALENQQVPPIANIHEGFEPDPELGDLNLSLGGQYPVEYALRLGAGFGSQIALTLVRRVPGVGERIEQPVYRRWLAEACGYAAPNLETVQRTLRVRHTGAPEKPPAKSRWQYGQGPTLWAASEGSPVAAVVSTPAAAVAFTPGVVEKPIPVNPGVNSDEVKAYVLEVVSEKTGYPVEMLDMDLDLEADLGIDTVKQAELFATIRTHYDIPRREDLRLSDYNTLTKVVQFMREALAAKQTLAEPTQVETEPVAGGEETETGPMIARRVPVPVLRPRLDLCVPTGVTLNEASRVVIVADRGKAGSGLARRLRGHKVQVLTVDGENGSAAGEKIVAFQAGGPVQGVYFLPGLDVEAGVAEMDAESWQGEVSRRAEGLFNVMRALQGEPFLVCGTRMGGLHGCGPDGATSALGGLVSGFAKALAWERPGSVIKVIDFSEQTSDGDVAGRLLRETLNDPSAVEVGWDGDLRFTLALAERPAGEERFALPQGSVFVVSGGSGGITGPILVDLARATRGKFYLLSRTPLPERDSVDLAHLRADKVAFKKELMLRLAQEGGKPTPAQVDQKVAALERAAATLDTIAAVEAAGGRAEYVVCDVTDASSAAQALAKIDEERVDVFIHAAGSERSRKLENKPVDEFRQTVAVKAMGVFHVFKGLEAAGKLPRAVVMFSSVAGRFGNTGQTDYSAANDLLGKLAAALPKAYPQIKALTLDWGAWAEVGMASRGFIPELMKRAGIEMLQPGTASGLVRRELVHGAHGGEVVLAGSLGLLEGNRHPQGGLDVEAANQALTAGEPIHAMFSRVTGVDLLSGVHLEAELDPQAEPFLKDHALNGIPLLPGVMGIEGFSVAARHIASVLASERGSFVVVGLEDIQFLAPFKFYRDQKRQISWKAQGVREASGLVVYVTLESTSVSKVKKDERLLHFRGKVNLCPVGAGLSKSRVTPPHWNGGRTITSEEIYKLYFHGPAFQVLEGVQVVDGRVLGKLRSNLPPIMNGEGSPITPVLIELCLQTAGVWEIGRTGSLALPHSIGQIRLFEAGKQGAPIFAEVAPVEGEGGLSFTARVVDGSGQVFLELDGYRTSALDYTMEAALIQPLKDVVTGQ